ncbi:hypothetical protein ACKUFS_11610 [Pseudomonas cannabina]|uniref:hypothetical protein n=1 Tax=Pseudomonas syringae group TaxID=136849 RepID=UPI0006B8957B|nr:MULTISPECIES: hypothetical protein [Pseudomonas syringae group]KPB77922.1 Uncharacterized protein AC507_1631 [Pseudomonas syringae pv. maculicola]QQN20134.1 hypothetical protein JGS08_15980 [Pseudomonas cannabina pv. alisalensis]
MTGTEKERDQLKAEAETLSETAMAQESMIEQLKEESFEGLYNAALDERDQLKDQCMELEGLLKEIVALDPRGEFMGWKLDGRIDAALSKPAGSDKV